MLRVRCSRCATLFESEAEAHIRTDLVLHFAVDCRGPITLQAA